MKTFGHQFLSPSQFVVFQSSQVSVPFNFAVASTWLDFGPKVNHYASKKFMPFSSKHVIFRSRRNHFWIKSILIEGSQYTIYQKRDQKIEQTAGLDEMHLI